MADVFTNPFFSFAGQKERLTNVANVLSIAVTGKDISGQKNTIVANTPSPIVNTVLEAAANHPFVTAGIGATAYTAAANAPAIVNAAKSGISTIAAKTGSVVSGGGSSFGGIGTTAAVGVAGLGIGALMGSKSSGGAGGTASAAQQITPQQTPTQQTDPFQNFKPNTSNIYQQDSYNINNTYGDNSPIESSQNPQQSNPFEQMAQQSVYPSQTSSLDAYGEADATGGTGGQGGLDWPVIALIGVGAYYLLSKN